MTTHAAYTVAATVAASTHPGAHTMTTTDDTNPENPTPVFEVEQSGADPYGWDPDDPHGDIEEYETHNR